MSCRNCGQEHAPIDVCLLGAVAGVVSDRYLNNSGAPLQAEDVALVDAAEFWEQANGLVDWMEAHLASKTDER